MKDLLNAWKKREESGELSRLGSLRVFHGPGEGTGEYQNYAIDCFSGHYWITHWGSEASPEVVDQFKKFLQSKNASSAVLLDRPEKALPDFPKTIFGEVSPEGFVASEGAARYRIRFHESRHPGLFLDHEPLRQWLIANAKNRTVLNTFSYTGSLSVASALGGATQVTTLDLSRPTIDWARENWKLNQLDPARGDFIYGDYFEWLPKFIKKNKKFDLIILDPPSFSRGKKGGFSTSKDLKKLHLLAWEALEENGFLVSSINSAKVPRSVLLSEMKAAASELKIRFESISEITLPPLTFPTRGEQDAYLKGYILKKKS